MVTKRTVRLALLGIALTTAARSSAEELFWSRYNDDKIGVAVDLPQNLFTIDRGPTKNLKGRTFARADGLADVSLYSIPKYAGETPKVFLEKRFQLPTRSVVYRRVTGRIVAVSGLRQDKIWYARCNFGSALVNCVALNYPSSEKRRWDSVVTRISNTLSEPRG
jgi:hypothetical protein